MNLTRKNSPRTYRMESSTPKVASRYLRGPTGSCHDHCKCVIATQPTEPKPIISLPKRALKPPPDRRTVDTDHSVNRLKRSPSLVSKAPTRITSNVKNNKFVKDEGVKRDVFKFPTKKDVVIEPKSRDSRPKSQVSRTTRRHSDIFNPNEEMVIPLRVPTRRLSDVGSISNATFVRGSSVSKNESRKDSKLPSVMNKKSNSKLPSVSIPKPVAKVLPPLRNYRSIPKPEVKGSRKLKPTKTIGVEVVPQKTPHAIERSKSQLPISSTSLSSSNYEEKVITRNWLQESCSPSMNDNTPKTDDQYHEKLQEEVGKLVVESIENQIPISSTSLSSSSSEEKIITSNGLQESCSPSMEDNTPGTDSQFNEKIEDLEDKTAEEVGKLVVESNENQIPISSTSLSSSSSEEKVITSKGLQESCSPSMEDNTPKTDGRYNEKIEDSDDKTAEKVGKLVAESIENQFPISSTSLSSSSSEEKVITCNGLQESCSPSMEDNTPETNDQHNDKTADSKEETTESQIPISSASSISEEKVMTQESPPSMEDDTPTKDANRVGKLVVETEEGSELELRFRRGKVVSPHSENNSPRKVQFKEGKELEENESWKSENKSLRRLSSDGVVMSPELISHSINVDLKHQQVAEKKDVPELNKVIEETASKLIQTRKSKVKALVGAFENITSGSNK